MADESADRHATTDMGEHLRTWKLFVSVIKWNLVGAGVLLLVLLAFRTHG